MAPHIEPRQSFSEECDRWQAAVVRAVKTMRTASRPRLRVRVLAQRLGLSFWEYYNMERGHSKMTAPELFAIARAIGCSYQVMCAEVVRSFERGPET